jgi:hypothetical protein
MSARHTPGPWRNCGQYDKLRDEVGATGKAIAVVWTRRAADGLQRRGETDADAEGEANARLIAAAPDLLEALQGLLRFAGCSGADDNHLEVRQAYDAIDKAIGSAT